MTEPSQADGIEISNPRPARGRISGGSRARGRFRGRHRGGSNGTGSFQRPRGDENSSAPAEEEVDIPGEEAELKSLRRQFASQLKTIRELFPDWSDVDLLFALQENGGEIETTVARISEGHASQWGEVKSKGAQRKAKSAAVTSSGEDSTDFERAAGRGRGRGRSERPSRERGFAGRGKGRANGMDRDRGSHVPAGRNVADTTGAASSDAWADATNDAWGDTSNNVPQWGGDNTRQWDGDSTPQWSGDNETQRSGFSEAHDKTDRWVTNTADSLDSKVTSQAETSNIPTKHSAEGAAEQAQKSSIIPAGTKSSWASLLKQVPAPKPALSEAMEPASKKPAKSETQPVENTSFSQPIPGSLISQATAVPTNAREAKFEREQADTDRVSHGLGTAGAGIARSASSQRRLNQDAAVIMPGSNQNAAAVDRMGVQFGSLGLDQLRAPEEEAHPRAQLPVQSPRSQRLQEAPMVAAETTQYPAQQSFSGAGVADHAAPTQGFSASRFAVASQNLDEAAQQPKQYEPFGQYGYQGFPQTQGPIPAGISGLTQASEHQSQQNDSHRGSFGYQQHGPAQEVPSAASLDATKPSTSAHDQSSLQFSRFGVQNTEASEASSTGATGQSQAHYTQGLGHQQSQHHQPQPPQSYPMQNPYYNPYAYYMNPQYGYGYGQQYNPKQAGYGHSYGPNAYGNGSPGLSHSRNGTPSEYARGPQPSTSSNGYGRLPDLMNSRTNMNQGLPQGGQDDLVRGFGDGRGTPAHSVGHGQNAGRPPSAGDHGQQHTTGQYAPHQPNPQTYSMYTGGFSGYPAQYSQQQQQSQHGSRPNAPGGWGGYGQQH